MSVSQILPGRISSALATRRLAQAITQNQYAINLLQTQLATGKKFLLPSESPTAAAQTLTLQKLEERRVAFAGSVQTNTGYLATADQTLSTISAAINQARGLAQAAAGDQITSTEREGMALEVAGLIRSIIQAGNTEYAGRYLFAGTDTGQRPFDLTASGLVRYNGNSQVIGGLADFGLIINSGIDGAHGLGAISAPEWSDLNPALSLETPLGQLYGGQGISPGSLRIVLDDGIDQIRKDIDLSSAQTIQDLKIQLEHAFAAEGITLTVDIDPTTQSGLRLTPSAGTVEVRELNGGTTARALGILSPPAAAIQGGDLNPTLSLHTPLAALNGGTGIGPTAGTGLVISNAGRTSVVDLDGAVTIQDALLRIRAADPDVLADISPDGQGIYIASRLSGADFSIGENGGDNATLLGLRTLTADVRIDDLNLGMGIPRETISVLQITRRDGSVVEVDVRQALTVQEVLDVINAIDPGVLTASLNAVGNGISLSDSSGNGPLTVAENALSRALGLEGTNNDGPAGVLTGRDVHPRQAPGALSLLIQLERAIRDNDLPQLERLAAGLDDEAARFAVVRGDLGMRQRQLDDMSNILADRQIAIQSQLSQLIDVDYAETITLFTAQQQALQAYLQMASQVQQLTLLNYL